MKWYLEGFKWYLHGLDQFAVFSGRSQRKAYWYFLLFNILIGLVLALIDIVLAAVMGMSGLSTVYSLITLIPTLALGCRRLHDTNRSGWWQIIALIPIAGMALFVLMIFDSAPGENQYGPSPKITPPVFKKWW